MENKEINESLNGTFSALNRSLESYQPQLKLEEVGICILRWKRDRPHQRPASSEV